MCWHLLLGLLSVGAKAYAPVPIRLSGLPTKKLFLTPTLDAFLHKTSMLPQKLAIRDLPSRRNLPDGIPGFVVKGDHTIVWEAINGCLEAVGTAKGDPVRVNHCAGGSRQRWNWLPCGAIQLIDSKQCLGVSDRANRLNEALIELRECDDQKISSWIHEDHNILLVDHPSQRAAFSASMRHAFVFSILGFLVAAVVLSVWLWRQHADKRCVASEMDRKHVLIDQGGVSLTALLGGCHSRTLQKTVAAVMAVDTAPPRSLTASLYGDEFVERERARGEARAAMIPRSKLRKGDYVVHTEAGVCIFEGMVQTKSRKRDSEGKYVKVAEVRLKFGDGWKKMTAGKAKEVLKLWKRKELLEPDNLPPLDLLHESQGNSWEKRKKKAAAEVARLSLDMVQMYADRAKLRRDPFPEDDERMAAFAAACKFEPTPHQHKAMADVHDDMVCSDKPMDRLILGDVGFGKTEVAMRAVYRAVCSGRQVGVLAPTTVLAAQHLRSLRDRMPDIRVELMASIVKRKPKEREALLADVADGKVDVLVGTHAVLSGKIVYKNIGLLVVDEEQRFGVKQKEKFKVLAHGVDVLTLTATPIPRTMYMCLAGLRSTSSLQTPPQGRLPVITEVMKKDEAVVEKAIRRELARGGQVFYVVPRIKDIDEELEMLENMLGEEVGIGYAYGGLEDLETRIVNFTLGKYDILLATSIMENGIDIPNVNTIIVQQAHMFGLSQLHQLRGRVGRSRLQAYAYLMHNTDNLQKDAHQRLDVMRSESNLGAGENIAKSDLEQRGAGNLIGDRQKGGSMGQNMKEMGVEMYMDMLQRVMRTIEKAKEEHNLDPENPAHAKILVDMCLDEDELMALQDSLKEKEPE